MDMEMFRFDVMDKLACIILDPDCLEDKRDAIESYEFVEGLDTDGLIGLYKHLKSADIITS